MSDMIRPENISEYINIDEALGRVRGNKNLIKRMLDMFLSSGEFQKMEDAIAQQDYASASDVSHAIKGISGNLSLTALFEISSSLNQQYKSGPASEEDVAVYRDILAKTIEAVKLQIQIWDAE